MLIWAPMLRSTELAGTRFSIPSCLCEPSAVSTEASFSLHDWLGVVNNFVPPDLQLWLPPQLRFLC